MHSLSYTNITNRVRTFESDQFYAATACFLPFRIADRETSFPGAARLLGNCYVKVFYSDEKRNM